MRDIYISRYRNQKAAAKKRGIPFLLTFEEWRDIWDTSGKLEQRGRRRGQYVMARFNDQGAYEVGNVRICTAGDNVAEGLAGKPPSGWARPGYFARRWAEASPAQRKRWMMHLQGKQSREPKSAQMREALRKTATGRRLVVRDDRSTWSYPGDEDYPA
jgi:hypothetical protein